jgi:hypothetical protein
MSSDPTVADVLNEPIHGPVPEDRPPWRDNAYVCFWDLTQEVLGVVHVSTSPNSEGRRARFSLSVAGRATELVETPLERESFHSESISYPLDDTIIVENANVSADLRLNPRLSVADYTAGGVIPPLVPGEPQHHYQQAVVVSGTIEFAGQRIRLDGDGFRDRTWGYRDESAHIVEYISFMAVFDEFAFTALRFHDSDGNNRVEGFHLSDGGTVPITDIAVTRDAAGLLAVAELTIGGRAREFAVTAKHGGFWVPMGPQRRGPTLSAYDELCALADADGALGHAFVEHAVLRRLF